MKNIFLICSIIVLISCSRTEPELAYASMRLVYLQESGIVKERFSFFVIANDEDGIENLADLYLYHDREGLRWRLSEKDWITVQQENSTWIGSRSIAMLDDETLPRGQYRAVLVNKAGEQAARNITFDPPPEPRFAFPALTISDGNYTVVSRYPANYFIGYDEQGNYVQTIPLAALQGAIADLRLNAKIRSVALWAEDAAYVTSALSDALAVN